MEVWTLSCVQSIVLLSAQRLVYGATHCFATRAAAWAFLARVDPEEWAALCWYHDPARGPLWEGRHPDDGTIYYCLSLATIQPETPETAGVAPPSSRIASEWGEHMQHLGWQEEDA